MRTLGTIFLAPLVIGLGIVAFALRRLGLHGFSILQWGLVVLAVLLAGVIVAALLNFAAFAPVYWLLGKWHPKKGRTATKHDVET